MRKLLKSIHCLQPKPEPVVFRTGENEFSCEGCDFRCTLTVSLAMHPITPEVLASAAKCFAHYTQAEGIGAHPEVTK